MLLYYFLRALGTCLISPVPLVASPLVSIFLLSLSSFDLSFYFSLSSFAPSVPPSLPPSSPMCVALFFFSLSLSSFLFLSPLLPPLPFLPFTFFLSPFSSSSSSSFSSSSFLSLLFLFSRTPFQTFALSLLPRLKKKKREKDYVPRQLLNTTKKSLPFADLVRSKNTSTFFHYKVQQGDRTAKSSHKSKKTKLDNNNNK